MNWRGQQASERLSAVVLLTAALLVMHWSRERIAATNTELDRREHQLEQVTAWMSGQDLGGGDGLVDCAALFGDGVEAVLAPSVAGLRVLLRSAMGERK